MRQLLVVLLMGVLPAVCSARALADDAAARAALEQHRFREALPLYDQALKQAPGDKATALGLARSYAGLLRFSEAITVVEAALEKHPEDRDLLEERATQYLNQAWRASSNLFIQAVAQASRDRALDAIDDLRTADPDGAAGAVLEARLLLLQADLQLADPEEAVEVLQPLLKSHADDPRVHYWMGRALFAMAKLDPNDPAGWNKAAEPLRQATKLAPKDGFAWFYLARAKSWLRVQGPTQAEYYERAALNLIDEPQAARALDTAIGWLTAYHKDQPRRALGLANRLLEQRPNARPFLLTKALSFYAMQKVDKAEEVFATARKEAPDDPFVTLAHGEYQVLTAPPPTGDGPGHPADEGVKTLIEAVQQCGDVLDRRVYDQVDLLAVRLSRLNGRQRDALWMALWTAYPNEVNAPGNAEVWWRDAVRDLDKSLEWCERALKTDPDDPMIHNDIGINLEELGRKPEAEKSYLRAIIAAEKKGINHPDKSLGYLNAVANLMELMLEEERYEDLRKLANKHLKDDPRYPTIMELVEEEAGDSPGE